MSRPHKTISRPTSFWLRSRASTNMSALTRKGRFPKNGPDRKVLATP